MDEPPDAVTDKLADGGGDFHGVKPYGGTAPIRSNISSLVHWILGVGCWLLGIHFFKRCRNSTNYRLLELLD
jgi:hypothetical protein